ncbi:chloride channel protein [Gemella sp. GH3]|uniref:chloride channel protein n=1 Tax=unclassified Gemella TaxID=2624949 RepID=UPI0015CFCE6E|nr:MULTISPECIES: chloride channel protein [unclassified Gemella]MBF0713718.1 chloride channel protein [Gemella sp. GH3.1]NYS50670.1 chloride channel protein [Gemella sp. GH3]
MKYKQLNILLISIMYSSIIGLFAFLFLRVEATLTHFLWYTLKDKINTYNILYNFVLIFIGTIFLLFIKKRYGDVPQNHHEVDNNFKNNGSIGNYNIIQNTISALVVLVVGAGVGPEATLMGILYGMSIWQADKARYIFQNYENFIDINLNRKLEILFHPTKYLNSKTTQNTLKREKLLSVLLIINGIIIYLLLSNLVNAPGFITKIGNIDNVIKTIPYALPIVPVVIITGFLYTVVNKQIEKFINSSYTINQKIILGGIVIFLIATFAHNLLFSGQHTMNLVVDMALQLSAIFLFLSAIIKLLFLSICLNTGWKGGDIFPLMFSAFLQGYAWSVIFPEANSTVMISIIATTFLITVSKQDIVALIVISLFFPINALPVIIVFGGLAITIKRFVKTKIKNFLIYN